jgi:hypothetical protein
MSASERPDLAAFKELETLVRNLGEELAMFRRRAIAAEALVKEPRTGEGRVTKGESRSAGSDSELAAENELLRARLGRTEERVRQMMERVRFLRQQLSQGAPAGAGR